MSAPRTLLNVPRSALLLLATGIIAQMGAALVQQGVAIISLRIRGDMHLNLGQMGLLSSATLAGVFVGMLVAGRLVDSRGPRWLLSCGVAAMTVFVVLAGQMTSYVPLLAVLFAIGVTSAAVPLSSSRAIFEGFLHSARGLVMSLRQTGVPIGGILAALLLPLALVRLSLPLVWVGLAVVLVATSTLFFFHLPRNWTVRNRGGWSFKGILPAIWPTLLSWMLVSGQYTVIAYIIPDLHNSLGWTTALGGVGLAVAQVGGITGRLLAGTLTDLAGGRRAPVLIALSLIAALTSLTVGVMPQGTGLLPVFVVLFLLGLGTIGWSSTTNLWAAECVPLARSGEAMSWPAAASFLGSAIYPPLFGHIVDVTHHFGDAWLALALWLTLAGAIAIWLVLTKRDLPHFARAAAPLPG